MDPPNPLRQILKEILKGILKGISISEILKEVIRSIGRIPIDRSMGSTDPIDRGFPSRGIPLSHLVLVLQIMEQSRFPSGSPSRTQCLSLDDTPERKK